MREFGFGGGLDGIEEILCLGAHSDDIEFGCGATICELTRANPRVKITWVVFSAQGDREREARLGAKRFLGKAARSEVFVQQFRDGFFPSQGAEIKNFFEEIKPRVDPDVIFTHFRDDRHQDHRVLSDLSWNTFRNHLILEYEIPKYDGDLGAPNLYVPINEKAARYKARELCKIFGARQMSLVYSGLVYRIDENSGSGVWLSHRVRGGIPFAKGRALSSRAGHVTSQERALAFVREDALEEIFAPVCRNPVAAPDVVPTQKWTAGSNKHGGRSWQLSMESVPKQGRDQTRQPSFFGRKAWGTRLRVAE